MAQAPTPPRPSIPVGMIVKVTVILLLFAGLAIALEGGWESLRQYQWQFEPWALAASFVVMFAASVLGALSWIAVGRAFGAPLPVLAGLRIYSTSNLGKYLPGKVWHAFARVYLAQQQGVPLSLATTTVVTDIVLYVAAGLLVMVLALPTIVRSLANVNSTLVMVVALAGVVAGLALLHPSALNLAFRLAGRIKRNQQFPPIEASYFTILKIFVLYLALWCAYTLGLYASIQAVHPVPADTFLTLGAIYALSYLSGLIMPLAPAGLGVREGLMALLLAQLMPAPAAAVASILVRVLQVAAEGLCAAVFSRV